MGLIVAPPLQTAWDSNLTATPAANAGTTLTANSTINTKATSYTTLIASSAYDAYGFWLLFTNSNSSTAASPQLCDIAIGGVGSEVIVVSNTQCGWQPGGTDGKSCGRFFPIFIPRGTRISARIQALISSDTVQCLIHLVGGQNNICPVFAGCDAYGVDTANSRGTLHTPGSTGAESADANIGSTLSRNYGAVAIEIGLGAQTVTTSGTVYHWELTDGTNTLCEWYTNSYTLESYWGPWPPAPYTISLKSGAQLQVQAECSGTAQQCDVAFRCFY
jgi:hypothetical protein